MGIIGAGFGLGFVFGPAIGGFLSGVSVALPGFAAAGLAFVNGLAALVFLPEPAKRAAAPSRSGLAALVEELGRPGIRRIIVVFFLAVGAFAAMEATFALLAEHRFGLDQRHVSWLFAFIGVLVAIVQGGLIGRLTRRFGEARLLLAGLLLQAGAFLALPLGPGVAGLYAACVPLAVGSGLATPSLTALLSKSARSEAQGGTLGMGQSAAALGRIIGPISATAAFGTLGFAAPYLGGAALLFLGAAISSTIRPGARAAADPPTP
jgi:predicted MFS family arabinose efflux permease